MLNWTNLILLVIKKIYFFDPSTRHPLAELNHYKKIFFWHFFTSPQLLVIAFRKHIWRPVVRRRSVRVHRHRQDGNLKVSMTNWPTHQIAGPQTLWHKALSSYRIYSSFALLLWRKEYGLCHSTFRIIWMLCKIRGIKGTRQGDDLSKGGMALLGGKILAGAYAGSSMHLYRLTQWQWLWEYFWCWWWWISETKVVSITSNFA